MKKNICYLAPHHHTRLNELSLLNEDAKEAQSKSHKRLIKTFKSREIKKKKNLFEQEEKSLMETASQQYSQLKVNFRLFLLLFFTFILAT